MGGGCAGPPPDGLGIQKQRQSLRCCKMRGCISLQGDEGYHRATHKPEVPICKVSVLSNVSVACNSALHHSRMSPARTALSPPRVDPHPCPSPTNPSYIRCP